MDIKSYYRIERKELVKYINDLKLLSEGVFSTSDDEILQFIDEVIKEHIKFYWTGRFREKSLEELLVLQDIVRSGEYEDKKGQEVSDNSEAEVAEVKVEVKGSVGKSIKGRGKKTK